jgi:hypothetical protein
MDFQDRDDASGPAEGTLTELKSTSWSFHDTNTAKEYRRRMLFRRHNSALRSAVLVILCCLSAWGEGASPARPANYNERKVGTYKLPDPLILADGSRVKTAAEWEEKGRPEILRLFATQMFGRTPPASLKTSVGNVIVDQNALGATAIRKQTTITFTRGTDSRSMHLLLYLPAETKGPVPVFLGLNFAGNQTVSADPGIDLNPVWVRDPLDQRKWIQVAADPKTRGSAASRWQVEKILSHGFGVATVYYGDIEPDFVGGMSYGIRPLFFAPGQTEPLPDEWGAIGAWAWGLSRAADFLQTDKDINPKEIFVIGHSRLGKTALWAGAQDTRFAMVISNDSGEGGAALSRRDFGETIERLNAVFPHWFCGNYKQYSNHAEKLPFDSHMLLALIAPRPLYVASAEDDLWSDPKGEFLGAVHAGPVYELLGKKGLGTDRMPAIHHPIQHDIGYHIRAGKHDVTAYDWDQYLKFAEMHFSH